MKSIHKYIYKMRKHTLGVPILLVVLLLVLSVTATLFMPIFASADTCSAPSNSSDATICSYSADANDPYSIDDYTNAPLITDPSNVVYGTDGNIWFSDADQASQATIVRMTSGGTITEFPISNDGYGISDIINGPDGNLWFTEIPPPNSPGKVGFITPGGQITEYTITGSLSPTSITVGSDGNLWFTDLEAIYSISTSGSYTEYPLPTGYGNDLSGITTGPDGNLWFTSDNGNYIGRMSTSGSYAEFPVPTELSNPGEIIAGSNNNLWFVGSGSIGQITTSGSISEYSLPSLSVNNGVEATSITTGIGGSVWFTAEVLPYNPPSSISGVYGDIDSSGTIHELPIDQLGTGTDLDLRDITTDPNGNLWMANEDILTASAILRINTGSGTTTPPPTTPPPPPNQPDYVAFGDSLTTGFSIPTCTVVNLTSSPWGCTGSPTATPYPDKVATALGYTYSDNASVYAATAPNPPPLGLDRVGIWGQTAAEAQADTVPTSADPWEPQLDAITKVKAGGLVTGEFGIDDLHFSDVSHWAPLMLEDYYLNEDQVTEEADSTLDSSSVTSALNALFTSLIAAKNKGAKVVVTLVYNPYANSLPCAPLHNGASELVDALDTDLQERATDDGLTVADFRPAFANHGAGSSDPYTFGTQCSITTALYDKVPSWLHLQTTSSFDAKVEAQYDPHPNNEGTTAMANAILEAIK